MSKKPTRAALAFKALVEFSDSIPAEDAGGAGTLLTNAFNAEPESPKVNSGQFSPGSAKGIIIHIKC